MRRMFLMKTYSPSCRLFLSRLTILQTRSLAFSANELQRSLQVPDTESALACTHLRCCRILALSTSRVAWRKSMPSTWTRSILRMIETLDLLGPNHLSCSRQKMSSTWILLSTISRSRMKKTSRIITHLSRVIRSARNFWTSHWYVRRL